MKTIIIIKGTHCNACKVLIEDVASETQGINSCAVDFTTGKTEVEHDENLNWTAFKKAVEVLGDYKVDSPQ